MEWYAGWSPTLKKSNKSRHPFHPSWIPNKCSIILKAILLSNRYRWPLVGSVSNWSCRYHTHRTQKFCQPEPDGYSHNLSHCTHVLQLKLKPVFISSDHEKLCISGGMPATRQTHECCVNNRYWQSERKLAQHFIKEEAVSNYFIRQDTANAKSSHLSVTTHLYKRSKYI